MSGGGFDRLRFLSDCRDITARWCATCQANKKLVFHSDAVLQEFAAKKMVALRADWTNKELARAFRDAPIRGKAHYVNAAGQVVWIDGVAH